MKSPRWLSNWKTRVRWRDIANSQRKAGFPADALGTAQVMEEGSEKANVLSELALARSEAGETELARKILADAFAGTRTIGHDNYHDREQDTEHDCRCPVQGRILRGRADHGSHQGGPRRK